MEEWKGALENQILNRKFWKNKRVLLTGFEGFLGSNLTKKLISLGANVIGLDIKVRRKETVLHRTDYDKIAVIKGSVTNYNLVNKLVEKHKIEMIFHLAAEALVEDCHRQPLNAFSTNIVGTWNVLEAGRNARSVKAIIVASSDKAYGNHKILPYREDAALCGNNTYDVSKSCLDLITTAYFNSYRLPVAITRSGNIYGPGDFNFSRIIPDCIRCALLARKFYIRSDGEYIRDYVFVDDIVNGYILLAEKLRPLALSGEAFNLSNEAPINVLNLTDKIFILSGRKPNYTVLNKAKNEIRRQFLLSRKARKILGWKPKYSLDEGLKLSIDWYKGIFLKER